MPCAGCTGRWGPDGLLRRGAGGARNRPGGRRRAAPFGDRPAGADGSAGEGRRGEPIRPWGNTAMARILVVDDEQVVRSLLKTILKHDGHEVLEAGDGTEAVEIHRNQPADLVMVDLVMPKKHGLDTILEMRENHPGTRFIVMTGALPSLLDSENMATMLRSAASWSGARQTAAPSSMSAAICNPRIATRRSCWRPRSVSCTRIQGSGCDQSTSRRSRTSRS